ncbi:MAG: Hpt domain-containing protein, partial [Desulfosudaceae bacterium]
MDIEALAQMHGLEIEEVCEIVSVFVEATRSDLNKIRTAAAGRNGEAAADAAHSLKGAAGNLGLTEILEAAKALETEFRQNRFSGAEEQLHFLTRQLKRIEEQLNT